MKEVFYEIMQSALVAVYCECFILIKLGLAVIYVGLRFCEFIENGCQ